MKRIKIEEVEIKSIDDLSKFKLTVPKVECPLDDDILTQDQALGYLVKLEEVKELVSYLQSKSIIWKDHTDGPEFHTTQNIIVITKDGSVDFCLACAFDGSAVSLLSKEVWYWEDYKKQIKYWCYLDDLIKTIPERIFDENN